MHFRVRIDHTKAIWRSVTKTSLPCVFSNIYGKILIIYPCTTMAELQLREIYWHVTKDRQIFASKYLILDGRNAIWPTVRRVEGWFGTRRIATKWRGRLAHSPEYSYNLQVTGGCNQNWNSGTSTVCPFLSTPPSIIVHLQIIFRTVCPRIQYVHQSSWGDT